MRAAVRGGPAGCAHVPTMARRTRHSRIRRLGRPRGWGSSGGPVTRAPLTPPPTSLPTPAAGRTARTMRPGLRLEFLSLRNHSVALTMGICCRAIARRVRSTPLHFGFPYSLTSGPLIGKRLQTYETAGITVTFDPTVCAHSGVCILGLSAVFDIRRKRWVDPYAASADQIAAQIDRCPSGALQYRRTTPVPGATQ